MSLRNIGIVYRKELTEALRDKRTLITTFLVPLLLIPVMGTGFTAVMSAVIGNAKKEKPSDDRGGTDSPRVVEECSNIPKSTSFEQPMIGDIRSSKKKFARQWRFRGVREERKRGPWRYVKIALWRRDQIRICRGTSKAI